MAFLIKHFLVIFIVVTALMGTGPGSAFCLTMKIDAIEDAGQFPGLGAYLRFVYTSPNMSGSVAIPDTDPPWTSRDSADEFANIFAEDHGITKDDNYKWYFESAGNIWSSDLFVGDSLTNLTAGVYRVSVLDGAFMYDNFNWSDYAGQWWWQLHVQSSMSPLSLMLGDTQGFGSSAEALENSFGEYLDIPVNGGGSLTFWIWDTNSIDNSGSLTFNVVLIPEPSTLLLVGTGLLFLPRRFRRSLNKTC